MFDFDGNILTRVVDVKSSIERGEKKYLKNFINETKTYRISNLYSSRAWFFFVFLLNVDTFLA